MPPGVCTMRRKLPVGAPNSGSPPVRQRSASAPSSGPSCRFIRAVLYRGGGSAILGEGVGSYFPPLHATDFDLQVSVACSRASLNCRSASAIFCPSGVIEGIRPLGGSTINEVRIPACLYDWNKPL